MQTCAYIRAHKHPFAVIVHCVLCDIMVLTREPLDIMEILLIYRSSVFHALDMAFQAAFFFIFT